MTTRIVLICHAATDATRRGRCPLDEDLDEKGTAALAGVGRPAAGRWRTGPELRARRTAAVLAGHEVAADPLLRDWDLGRWRGRTLEAVGTSEPEALAAWISDPAAAPHGGESLEVLLVRVAAWMAAEAAQGGRLAAVSHPAVARAAAVLAIGAGAAAFWRIDASPLGRLRLSHDGRRWTLQALVPPTEPSKR